MLKQFIDWVMLTVDPLVYTYSRGMWIDSAALDQKRICAIAQQGGPEPYLDVRRQRFRVILLGRRNNRAEMIPIEDEMSILAQAAMGDSRPCDSAYVRAIGEPMGPSATVEGRIFWVQDYEVIF